VSVVPPAWSAEWLRRRAVTIKFRRAEAGFTVRSEYESADGRRVHVYRPRVMEAAADGGHRLYAGEVCWDVVEAEEGLPIYLSEADFEWVTK